MVSSMLQGSLRTFAVLSLGLLISPAALSRRHKPDQPAPAPAPADAGDAAPAEETAGESGEASAEVRPAEAPDAAMDEARRRYAQGSEYYRRGRYAEAVAEFSEAYSLWPNPVILYALGQAYEGQSDANRAIETYQRFLEVAPEGDLRRQDAELTSRRCAACSRWCTWW
jgi:tetratricopeptide (TPR) repeat protein